MSVAISTPKIIYSIQPATWRDLPSLRQLEKACFPKDFWPLLDLIGVLTFPDIVRFKASTNEKMVGFVAGERRMHENVGWISTIGVLPEYRKQGIGTDLLEACELNLKMKSVRLNVRISNRKAVRLYLSLGYHEINTWPAYYYDREDALVLEKNQAVSGL